MPAGAAPLRTNTALFTYQQRFALLRQAFAEEIRIGRVRLSSLERRLPQPNYTIDTLTYLQRLCTQRPTIVIGADQAANISRWHRAAELMHRYEFLVFARRGAVPEFPAAMRYNLIADFDDQHEATTSGVNCSALQTGTAWPRRGAILPTAHLDRGGSAVVFPEPANR